MRIISNQALHDPGFKIWRGGVVVEWSVPLPARPARFQVSARFLPTVWSEGRQIALLMLYNKVIKLLGL